MSGHSKWSSIKHKKGAADAKRGKIFTRIVKEIIIAARDGGGDHSANPRLRLAINLAKGANMPNNNIESAIKRGTGEIEGANYEHYFLEGYGQNGVAILVETLTDNKQRTVSEVRHVFSKYGGNLAESGAVSWMFEQKGLIVIAKDDIDEDEMMMGALEAGADDVVLEDDEFEIYTPYAELHNVLGELEKTEYTILKAELTYLPKNTVKADNFYKNENLSRKIMIDEEEKLVPNFDITPFEVVDTITRMAKRKDEYDYVKRMRIESLAGNITLQSANQFIR